MLCRIILLGIVLAFLANEELAEARYQGGMNLYGYVGGMPTRFADPMGTEQHYFDPDWVGSSGCFDYCTSAGNSANNCYHYCFENNSFPDDWPDLPPNRKGEPRYPPNYPPLWIVDEEPLGEGSRDDFLNWEPDDDFESQDDSASCKCYVSPGDDKVSIERPTGQLGNTSLPGYGIAECVIGEMVLAEYKGICRGTNCACEQNERGACKVLILWRCEKSGTINNWVQRQFPGQCDERN